ncbi:MAG: type II toxin-antitoxin system death-on-curing family toxin [Euryarchaeota archaeon]|nr:type II toxin-antitoxin system death-on-curing family toxin [Euryarchaeota archaeon]
MNLDGGGSGFKHLSAYEIIEIHDDLIAEFGGERGVIYEGGIYFVPEKAAIKRSLEAAAAVYLFEIITMHPFLDGNKRTGLSTCGSFLLANGFYLDVDAEEGKRITLEIAQGKLNYEKTVEWIRKSLKRL